MAVSLSDSPVAYAVTAAGNRVSLIVISSAVTKNGIGGGDVKFAGAAALVLGFFNTAAALVLGLLAAVVINKLRKQKSFPLLPYLAPAFMTAYFIA